MMRPRDVILTFLAASLAIAVLCACLDAAAQESPAAPLAAPVLSGSGKPASVIQGEGVEELRTFRTLWTLSHALLPGGLGCPGSARHHDDVTTRLPGRE